VGEDEGGWRDLLLARSALTLSSLPRVQEPKARLKDTRQELQTWLEKQPDDAWARWLLGEALRAAGEYDAALEAFERAGAGEGPVVALIAAGNLLLDRGDAAGALERYERALERAPQHPLALMGRVFHHIESGADSA